VAPNIFENYSASDVFRDRHTLYPEFVPDRLPCRDAELNQLVANLKILLDPHKLVSVNVAITGAPGFGKTTIAKKTIKDLEKAGLANGINIQSFYVNCHSFRTKTSILRKIATDKFHIQGRGFSDEELIEMVAKRLEKENLRLVLAIDEATMLKGEDILSFIHLNELFESDIGRLSVIVICRRSEWTLMLDAPLSGRIQDLLNLEGYDMKQLREILDFRKEMAFFADVISDEVMDQIVQMSYRNKNARHGIEIMLRAGMKANAMNSAIITPELVRDAKTEVYPELRSDVFVDLKTNELLAALSIGRELSRSNAVATTINDVYTTFELVCNEYKHKTPSMATFRVCIETLEKLGVVSQSVSSLDDGSRGRRAKITIFDIPASVLVERVENVVKSKLK